MGWRLGVPAALLPLLPLLLLLLLPFGNYTAWERSRHTLCCSTHFHYFLLDIFPRACAWPLRRATDPQQDRKNCSHYCCQHYGRTTGECPWGRVEVGVGVRRKSVI